MDRDELLEVARGLIASRGARPQAKRREAVDPDEVAASVEDALDYSWEPPQLSAFRGVRRQVEGAQRYLKAGRWEDALRSSLGIVRGFTDGYDPAIDEDGEVASELGEAIEVAGKALPHATGDRLQGELFDALLGLWWADVGHGGIGLADSVPDLFRKHTTPKQRQRIARSVKAHLPEMGDRWGREASARLFLDLAGDGLDDAEAQKAVKRHVLELSTKCGQTDRKYRNTLVFLAAAQRGMGRLKSAYRERAALRGVRADYAEQIPEEDRADLKSRVDEAERVCRSALGSAYTVALRVSGQQVEHAPLSDSRDRFSDHLAFVWATLVEDEEWILRRVGSVTLQKTGLVPQDDGLRLKDALEAFLRYTDKPMLATKDALVEGLVQACRDGIVGIGRGTHPSKLQSRACGELVSIDASEEGVWIIPAFEKAPEPTAGESEVPPAARGPVVSGASEVGTGSGTTAPVPGVQGRRARRFIVKGVVPTENWADVFRSFVHPSARMSLKKVRLGIEFEMETAVGAPVSLEDPNMKTMREAARQLGLKFEVVEE